MTSPTPAPGTSRLVAGVATLGALVLLAGVAASFDEQPTAELTTRVAFTTPGAVLVSASGERPARQGAEVRRGTTVRTAGGELVLATGDRDVRLAPGTALEVLDGARQRLTAGTALVDARDGRELQVAVGGARVDVDEDAMVRLESGPLARVATYSGRARVGSAGRRARTDVPRLRQVQVPDGALPGRATPLALREGDAWEGRLLRPLVEADRDLRMLEDGLTSGAAVVSVSLPGDLSAQRAEQTLAYALAVDAEDGFSREVLDDVLEGRSLGGSWGVVAELAGTSVGNAIAFIDGATPADEAEALAQGRRSSDERSPVFTLPGAEAAPTAAAAPTEGPRPSAPAQPAPTSAPRPTSGPSSPPSPRPDLVGTVGDTVGAVVDGVTGLLPTRLPLPPAPRPAAPSRAPLVDLELDVPLLDPLLDPLVGGLTG